MSKTDKILVITESPHKAKVISKILKDAGYTNAKTIASVGLRKRIEFDDVFITRLILCK